MRLRLLSLAGLFLLAGTVFAAPPPDSPRMSLTHPNVFMVPQVSSPPIQFQNAGTPIGIAFIFNCGSGMSCSIANGVMTATSTGGSGTITSCGTTDALAYYSAATTINCDGAITTNTTGTLTDVVTIGGNGSLTNPTFAYAGETGLGTFRRAAGVISVAQGGTSVIEFISGAQGGARTGTSGQFSFTAVGSAASAQDTALDRFGPKIVGISDGTNQGGNAFLKTGMTVTTAADVTCGTGGTIADCTAATTISGLTITLPLVATNWHFECTGVVSQATGTAANQWLIQTATNGATSTTAAYMMATAATALAVGAVTDQSSTTTAFQITPSWTLGATGTKMPFRVWGTLTGVSVSGTVFNFQVINPTNADLLTIFEGASCSLTP